MQSYLLGISLSNLYPLKNGEPMSPRGFAHMGSLLFSRSWPLCPSCSSYSPPLLCLSTPSRSFRRRMNSDRPATTPSWHTWRRCALLGLPWSTSYASSPRQTSGSSLKAHSTSLTCWPSCPIMSPSSSRSPTRACCSSRTCGVWSRSSASCGSSGS